MWSAGTCYRFGFVRMMGPLSGGNELPRVRFGDRAGVSKAAMNRRTPNGVLKAGI
jgi:hypothetical protein